MLEKIDINSLFMWAIGAAGGAVAWFAREVLTNKKQIALLTAHLTHRDELRLADREADREAFTAMNDKVDGVHTDVRELRNMMENRSRK